MLVPVMDDAGTRGEPIPIPWQTTLIGRDPARAQIVFADKSVSRLHARIVEETDRVFVLHDEGSSSGTYVNEQQVDVSRPRTLKAGDLLEFGRVRVIFQPVGDVDSQLTQSASGEDITEPLVKRHN
jgi:pSer/pThr/pTyr-binding forkhead associated (FHA) protein